MTGFFREHRWPRRTQKHFSPCAVEHTSCVRWKLWKPLFRLSFVAAILTLPHVLYAPFASRPLAVALYTAALLISLLRWLPERKSA